MTLRRMTLGWMIIVRITLDRTIVRMTLDRTIVRMTLDNIIW